MVLGSLSVLKRLVIKLRIHEPHAGCTRYLRPMLTNGKYFRRSAKPVRVGRRRYALVMYSLAHLQKIIISNLRKSNMNGQYADEWNARWIVHTFSKPSSVYIVVTLTTHPMTGEYHGRVKKTTKLPATPIHWERVGSILCLHSFVVCVSVGLAHSCILHIKLKSVWICNSRRFADNQRNERNEPRRISASVQWACELYTLVLYAPLSVCVCT